VIGGVDWLQPAGVNPGQPPGFNLQASTSATSASALANPATTLTTLTILTILTILHNPHTRPLAGSAAAIAGRAPPHCVIAPRPELEKACLLGRCSRPLSAAAGPQTHHQSLLGLAITPLASPSQSCLLFLKVAGTYLRCHIVGTGGGLHCDPRAGNCC
jgi:hypothetical protein